MKLLKIMFKRNVYLNLLTITIACMFFLVLGVLLVNLNAAEIEGDTVRSFAGQNMYQISDSLLGQDKEANFFRDERGYKTINRFNKQLAQSNEFTYYATKWQPIGIADFEGGPSFDPRSNEGSVTPPNEVNGTTFNRVLSYQLNQTVFDINQIKFVKGEGFTKEDYEYKDTQAIKVILGNHYNALYEVGDTLKIFIYNKVLKAEVIGIMASSQTFTSFSNPTSTLDNYIVLPAFTFSSIPSKAKMISDGDEIFYRASLLSRLNSSLFTELSPLEVRDEVSRIGADGGFEEYNIIGADGVVVDTLVNLTNTNLVLIYTALAVTFLLSVLAFLYTFSLKIRRNVDVYSVFLISGATHSEIKKEMVKELFLFNILAVVIAALPFMVLTGGTLVLLYPYVFISALVILCTMMVAGFYLKREYNRVDIVQHLKR